MKHRKRIGIVLIVAGILALLSGGGFWLLNSRLEGEAADFAAHTMEELHAQIGLVGLMDGDIGADRDAADIIVIENGIEGGSGGGGGGGMRAVVIEGSAYIGVLGIPSLRLDLPINGEWSYPALLRTPCRFSGDVESNSLVIAAHNYQGHFGNITTLPMGDLVTFTSVDGTVYRYQVVEIETLLPSGTYVVTYSEYDLTLFTCTYSGQARAVVRCMRMDDGLAEEN